MLVLNFIRYVMGYVCFTACGGFPERFLNLCRMRGIILWDLRSIDGVIHAKTDRAGYRRIRAVAKKSGMRVRISQKLGLPFFLNRHSKRAGLIVGACLCISMLCILSTRIWSIDVIGNKTVPSEEIISVFEELGIKKGVASKKVGINAVEIEALRRLPALSWLNINISGSSALIEVRERVVSPEAEENGEPSDIVASSDGQIVILRPFNGTQEQKIGNPVLKGDLLISGIEENRDLTVSFCRAKGYVVARTNRSISHTQNDKIKAKTSVVRKKSYIIDFLFFSIPIGKTFDNAYREKSEIRINGVTLPVAFTTCTETVFEDTTVTLSKEKTKLLAALGFYESCSEQFRYIGLENAEISFAESENGCSFSGNFVCLENIGEERKKAIEEQAVS